ncbi:MAG TPA: phosphohydrolase [Acidimicrobiia bacterium]|jgi:hypothetical protein|nr:phosphohydrolase [Acidimicrobiia bacterium]
MVEIVTDSALIDEILGRHEKGLGLAYLGYRNHCLRMLNIGRYLVPDEPHRDDRFAIMAAFHDLPFFLDGDLDYLGRATEWAKDYLEATGRAEWEPEIRLMIQNHHKVRPYRGPSAPMVDAMRKADWIDVTFTKVRFGIPRSFIRDVRAAFPMNEAYKGLAMPMIGRYAISHLSRPLPMMRW